MLSLGIKYSMVTLFVTSIIVRELQNSDVGQIT